jgi:hypothetical protein
VLSGFGRRVSFSNVVSLVALFVALSGGAYALSLPGNSVGARQLKRGAVTNSKIKDGAVTAAKVKPRSLVAGDFKLGQLPAGQKGAKGTRGIRATKGIRAIRDSRARREPLSRMRMCAQMVRSMRQGRFTFWPRLTRRRTSIACASRPPRRIWSRPSTPPSEVLSP